MAENTKEVKNYLLRQHWSVATAQIFFVSVFVLVHSRSWKANISVESKEESVKAIASENSKYIGIFLSNYNINTRKQFFKISFEQNYF